MLFFVVSIFIFFINVPSWLGNTGCLPLLLHCYIVYKDYICITYFFVCDYFSYPRFLFIIWWFIFTVISILPFICGVNKDILFLIVIYRHFTYILLILCPSYNFYILFFTFHMLFYSQKIWLFPYIIIILHYHSCKYPNRADFIISIVSFVLISHANL